MKIEEPTAPDTEAHKKYSKETVNPFTKIVQRSLSSRPEGTKIIRTGISEELRKILGPMIEEAAYLDGSQAEKLLYDLQSYQEELGRWIQVIRKRIAINSTVPEKRTDLYNLVKKLLNIK